MKNYALAVPIHASYRRNQSAQGFISKLKEIGADCVWLCASPDDIYEISKARAAENGVNAPENAEGYAPELLELYWE